MGCASLNFTCLCCYDYYKWHQFILNNFGLHKHRSCGRGGIGPEELTDEMIWFDNEEKKYFTQWTNNLLSGIFFPILIFTDPYEFRPDIKQK